MMGKDGRLMVHDRSRYLTARAMKVLQMSTPRCNGVMSRRQGAETSSGNVGGV
jgi:hypothetical protein